MQAEGMPAVSTYHTIDLEGLNLIHRGKVRDLYDLGEALLIVASDRVSAFDVVMPQAIPNKGEILTRISRFWFSRFEAKTKHHLLPNDFAKWGLEKHQALLAGRVMICRKVEVLPVECIVRGYLAGSGFRDYQKTGAVCGLPLPEGLQKGQQLPEPLFTPSTKAEQGEHDENISFDEMVNLIGEEKATYLKNESLRLYSEARDYAASRGILLADTKLEWGITPEGEVLLIDEIFTPDSSRFWPADQYKPGEEQPSLDKEFLREYLMTLDWNKQAPGPDLPTNIVTGIEDRYQSILKTLTGDDLNSIRQKEPL